MQASAKLKAPTRSQHMKLKRYSVDTSNYRNLVCCLFFCVPATWWMSCWRRREHMWRSCCVCWRWVLQNVSYSVHASIHSHMGVGPIPSFIGGMTGKLKVLWVCWCNVCDIKLQGYAAEMDNPAMAHLIPSTLLSKKDVLFGNMSEIYQFHKRYASFTQFASPGSINQKPLFTSATDSFAHFKCVWIFTLKE